MSTPTDAFRSPEREMHRTSKSVASASFGESQENIPCEPKNDGSCTQDKTTKHSLKRPHITFRASGLSLKQILGVTKAENRLNYSNISDGTAKELSHRLRDGNILRIIERSKKIDCCQLELDEKRLDCPEELYNLTKLAEVSLAAAAGHVFSKKLKQTSLTGTPEQEYPEDLSKDSTDKVKQTCRDCGKRYTTSSNLARHRQIHRSLADKKARRCPHCPKVYVSMPAFAMHIRTHNQGCKCPICGKCFSRPWLLQGHIRTHTGEKPFLCSICRKAFADKSNLRAHVQTHSNLKPHACARCGKSFALKSYLYKHEESSCMKLTPGEA